MSTTSSTTTTGTTASTISTSSSSSTVSTTSTSLTTSTSSTTSSSTSSTTATSVSTTSSTTTTTYAEGVRLTADIDLTGLVIENEFSKQLIDSDVEYSLDGRPIIWEQEIPSGKAFDLIGTDDSGWLQRSVLNSLQTLAAVPNSSYTLRYEGELKTVRFRNEDQPVISADLIIDRSNPDDTDWYNNVRIKLMEF